MLVTDIKLYADFKVLHFSNVISVIIEFTIAGLTLPLPIVAICY